MSFELNWEALTEPDSLLLLRDLINRRLAALDFYLLQDLHLHSLLLPVNPPEIVVEDILPPPPEFLAHIDPSHAQEEDCAQVVLRVQWSAAVVVEMSGVLAVNYPAPGFARLPVRLCIREIHLNGMTRLVRIILSHARLSRIARMLFIRAGSQTFLSLQRDKDMEISISFDSEIGDPSRHSTLQPAGAPPLQTARVGLKNVGKVETFLQNVIHKLIDMMLVFPNHITINTS